MAQMVSRGPRAAATGVLTVADLLSRNAPVPARIALDETTAVVSVGALLRREGRAPHAIDRPVQPRVRPEDDEEPPAGITARRVRRAAVAAGTLLAAGSVFGAAVLTDASSTRTDAQGALDGSYPGQGLLDQAGQPLAPPGVVVIDPAAASGALDPGAASMSWAPVAFPTAFPGVSGGSAGPAAQTPTAQTPTAGPGGTTAPATGTPGGGSVPPVPPPRPGPTVATVPAPTPGRTTTADPAASAGPSTRPPRRCARCSSRSARSSPPPRRGPPPRRPLPGRRPTSRR